MRTPLQKAEKILLVTHLSWVVLIVPALVALAGIVASYFIGFSPWGWIVAVLGIVFFIARYFSWRVNIWVVTNFRVIDEYGLMMHFAKESPLGKINNVSYDQSVWGRIWNYGHVEIQTAAQVGATDYYMVQHPKKLKETITSAQSEYDQNRAQAQYAAAFDGAQHTKNPPQSMAAELEKLFELKQKGILSEQEYNTAKAKWLNS